MSLNASHHVLAPREKVWQWHTRPGAVVRLTPPFLPMRPIEQARSLADGTTTFALPARQRWVAKHVDTGYREGAQFQDTVVNQPLRTTTQWVHTHSFADAGDGATTVTDDIDTRVPRFLLEKAVAYRQHQLIADFKFLSTLPDTAPLTVAMTGASGLVGTALAAQLGTAGHTVIALSRSRGEGAGTRHWDVDKPAANLLSGVDAVIHLAGESIMGRFTEKKKRAILESRVGPTEKLARLAADSGVSTFVSASAVGYYGSDAGGYEHDESAPRGTGFLAEVCEQWEQASRVDGLRTVNIRTGLALSGAGGLLPVMRLSASTGAGARFGQGENWMSWIALDDLTDIYVRSLIDARLSGPVNATAPHPVTNAEFSATLTDILRRPDIVSIPKFGPAVLLGREGADELALASQRVVPRAATEAGADFRYPTLETALAHELGRESLVDQA
ncbi:MULTISPECIES: TIGR01777 family oxidoreductase [Corynebacterium]|uniref:TIGR01777 family oxidoreductase n=1 Tax=Corynebacterium TaxID=1716 RepID=UPI0011A96C88|nr:MULTISPECIES: TIGR01777 family oxidoreductase [Corynebacterium]MCT1463514.1 TIGR01777 family oxidoreductase [Corynebacterium sanguinis]MCT1498198.1 TIGR01777 family oxidoreductase [Corynebacterium sanguinis]MCT2329167.1 TIGR01777 family oxidoreductase [Corynebacterium sanguinis]WNI12317.1 TIGR01777 family oxidoreductase [Corynebacterium sp. Z-1]